MTLFLTVIFALLWLTRTAKADLFWLYLLQLKEYRIDRLRDHFETGKGKSIIINYLIGIKFLFLFILAIISIIKVPLIFTSIVIALLATLYSAEIADGAKKYIKKNLIIPKFTSKAIILSAIILTTNLIFLTILLVLGLGLDFSLAKTIFFLVAFDILTPVKNVLIILSMKPLNLILKKGLFNRARRRREELKDTLVIGITGSYGKTTTKEMLTTILKEKFNVISTKEHENTEVAIAKLVTNELNEDHEIFICEMGAYKKGEIKTIAEIIKPDIGIFIGANAQHLSLFGSMENIIMGEGGGELLQSMKSKSLGIFNGNNIYAEDLYKKANIAKRMCRVEYSEKDEIRHQNDVWAKKVKPEKNSVSFKVFSQNNRIGETFTLNFPGKHNIENLLPCIALAEELGMNLKEISSAVLKIKPMPRAMTVETGKFGLNIIDATYSSNPTGVYSHLDYLNLWKGAKKIIIMPCLIELGSKSKDIHQEIGIHLGKVADLAIITTKDRFDEIKIGFYESAKSHKKGKRILLIENQSDIIKMIKDNAKKGDVLLFEGRTPEGIIRALSNSLSQR